MNPIRTIRRLAGILAGLAAALVACTAAAPAAFATNVPPPGMGDPGNQTLLPTIHTVTVGGMAGWQIVLIAVGSGLLASALTLLAVRVAQRATPALPSRP